MAGGREAMKLARCIREATSEDSAGLSKCMEAAYAPYQARMGGVRLPPMDVDYSAEIKNYPTWVVESEGNIQGGLIMIFANDEASIANIAVNPQFQGQGIGRELLGFAEAKARDRKFSELRLATHVLLEENISLYRYFGWQETGRDGTRVLMKKEI